MKCVHFHHRIPLHHISFDDNSYWINHIQRKRMNEWKNLDAKANPSFCHRHKPRDYQEITFCNSKQSLSVFTSCNCVMSNETLCERLCNGYVVYRGIRRRTRNLETIHSIRFLRWDEKKNQRKYINVFVDEQKIRIKMNIEIVTVVARAPLEIENDGKKNIQKYVL